MVRDSEALLPSADRTPVIRPAAIVVLRAVGAWKSFLQCTSSYSPQGRLDFTALQQAFNAIASVMAYQLRQSGWATCSNLSIYLCLLLICSIYLSQSDNW